MDADRLKQIGDRAQELGKLKKHPSWKVLREVCESKRDRLSQLVAKDIVSGEPIDQRKLDYLRGWAAATEHLLAVPENAESALETALKKARQLEELTALV